MFNSKQAVDLALQDFPRWMDIKKRAKSVGRKLLESIYQEQDNIKLAYEEFIKSFFLKTYNGKEDTIPCHVLIGNIGKIDDIKKLEVLLNFPVTENPKVFLDDPKHTILLQDIYVILDPSLTTKRTLDYIYNNNKYSLTLKEQDLWNIFDEFALFSSLERFPNESNSELVKRIYAQYKTPPSSPAKGIKNAIINSVKNYDSLDEDEIIIEEPNGANMYELLDNGNTVYEELSSINKDILREKVWNHSLWENNFKKSRYLSNVWDKPLYGYQAGTGQRNDLKVKLSSDSEGDKTNLEVIGYQFSPVLINEFIRKRGLKQTIPLTLTRYNNELNGKDIEYKITATPAQEIDAKNILIKSIQHAKGQFDYNIEDILVDKGDLIELQRGLVDANKTYTLKFFPRSDYDDMAIYKADFISKSNQHQELLIAKGAFRKVNGVFKNADVKAHVSKTTDLIYASNVEDVIDGITIGYLSAKSTLGIEVDKGMSGFPVLTSITCPMTNYTDSSFVTLTGNFELISNKEIQDKQDDSSSQIVIEMDTTTFSYELVKNDNNQGTVTAQLEIDGEIHPSSGLLTEPKIYEYDFKKLVHLKLTLTKAGAYPVTIRNIQAARYKVEWRMDKHSLIKTRDYVKFPVITEKDTLYLDVEAYSNNMPIIHYIHVGPSVKNSSYVLSKIATQDGGRFDIQTDCSVELYEVNEDKETLVNSDYKTKAAYKNNNASPGLIYITLKDFINIKSSSMRIVNTAWRGKVVGSISVPPGETIDTLRVEGEFRITRESRALSDFLIEDNTDKVYIAGNADGFIVQHNGKNTLKKITNKQLIQNTDEYFFDKLPQGIQGVFVAGTNKQVSDTRSGAFDYCYLTTQQADTYVAYNKLRVFQQVTMNVPLVNTFSPLLDMNRLMFYSVEGTQTTTTVLFQHTDATLTTWALGKDYTGFRVECTLNYTNSKSYSITVANLSESFTLANSIRLKPRYVQDNETYELARFLITPPSSMKVVYEQTDVEEKIIVEKDGFNKLYFSNVQKILSIKVDNVTLKTSDYSLIQEPGVILWNTDQYVGKQAVIQYEYLNPTYLEFKDISSLYELIGYSVDAYKPINVRPQIYSDLQDGAIVDVVIDGIIPDRLSVKCSNENFSAVATKNRISVKRFATAVVALVHSGYYYDQEGKEYYMYENDHADKVNRFSNLDILRFRKIADQLHGSQESSNYVRDSAMDNGEHQEILCEIDCATYQHRMSGISQMDSITACDSYQAWNDYEMSISLAPGLNGLGLKFTPNNSTGYAYLDITPYIRNNSEISFYADQTLNASLLEEVLVGPDRMIKSVHAEKVQDLSRVAGFYYHSFGTLNPEKRYYLCIQGTGMMDDMIVKNKTTHTPDAMKNLHKKNINKLGFDIQEYFKKNSIVSLDFDRDGNDYDALELTDKGIIRTGANVDWGVTLVKNLTRDFKRFKCQKVDLRKNVLTTKEETGTLTSPIFSIRNYNTIDKIFIKINEALVDPFRFFNVKVYSFSSAGGADKKLLGEKLKTNLCECSAAQFEGYLQVEIEMPPKHIINNLEVYVRYVENNNALHINPAQNGELITKVYNTTSSGTFSLQSIDVDNVKNKEFFDFSIRALRYDNNHEVWTNWYKQSFNENWIVEKPHEFKNFQFFQFKVKLRDQSSEIRINKINLEVS
jgi:hypothetical protein